MVDQGTLGHTLRRAHVSLRVRLVAGLVLLMAVGLGLFGVVTYGLYSHAQYKQVDDQLRGSVGLVSAELARRAGVPATELEGSAPRATATPPAGAGSGAGGAAGGVTPPFASGGNGGGHGPPTIAPPGSYGELIGGSGRRLAEIQVDTSSSQPNLPSRFTGTAARYISVGSSTGSGSWRVYVGPVLANGDRVVVAVPLTGVISSLHRLILIEVSGAAVLLVVLSTGAMLMLRRGLAPIERMADTAKDIAAGDLSQRVTPGLAGSEVGQLGRAFNSMLDEIETAFAEREATEVRLRQFLADASHELRTPLTSIRGFAELFRLGANHPQLDPATMVRRIEEESARMQGLVDDLLLLARLDRVRDAEPAPVDLSVLAADACSDAIAAAPARPVALTAPQPVVVMGDEAHLRQAIANLVTNALRHTPEGTPIEVGAGLDHGLAVVSVRDHGPGLDDEAQRHVFDRFWQRDPSRAGAGSGLGLSIVAGVAAQHGGSAGAANVPGGGAVFTVCIPLVAPPAGDDRSANPPVGARPISP